MSIGLPVKKWKRSLKPLVFKLSSTVKRTVAVKPLVLPKGAQRRKSLSPTDDFTQQHFRFLEA
jgi:hypothetical protein